MNKLRILVTASTFPRFKNDTEPRFIYDLCYALQKYFEITVLVPADPATKLQENINGLRVIRFRYAPLRKLETLAYPGAIISRLKQNPLRCFLVPLYFWGLHNSLKRILKNEHFDCVHAHWLIPQGIIQSFFSKPKYPPYVITGHGGDIGSLNNYFVKILKKKAIKKSSGFNVVSYALKENIKGIINQDIKNVQVIPMGCDCSRFSPKFRDKNYYERYGIIDKTVILFVGRLDEKKGIEYLIKSLNNKPISDTNSVVVIVGDGPLKNDLIELTNKLNLDKRVFFIGSKSHEELPVIYASSDIFCAPSIIANNGDKEGLPTVIIEAEASGLPVVSTNISGIPEVVINNETGILVKEKDSIELSKALYKLVSSMDIRQRMGKNGLNNSKKYSWDVIAYKYYNFLMSSIRGEKNGYEI